MFSGSVSSGTNERREKKRKKSRRRTEKQQIVLGGAKAEDVMGRRRVWVEGRRVLPRGIQTRNQRSENV